MSGKIGDIIFNLRMQSKTLQKESAKCEKRADSEKLKVKKAIEQGNEEGARVYAENAIREKNTYLQFLRLSARIDGIVSRLQTMQAMGSVVKNLDDLNNALGQAVASFNLNKINEILKQFEKNMGKIEDISTVLDERMGNSTETVTSSAEVNQLLQDVVAENNLNFQFSTPLTTPQQPLSLGPSPGPSGLTRTNFYVPPQTQPMLAGLSSGPVDNIPQQPVPRTNFYNPSQTPAMLPGLSSGPVDTRDIPSGLPTGPSGPSSIPQQPVTSGGTGGASPFSGAGSGSPLSGAGGFSGAGGASPFSGAGCGSPFTGAGGGYTGGGGTWAPTEKGKANRRTIQKAIREIDRERIRLEQEERKLIADLKKNAAQGHMDACKVIAKSIIRTRGYIQRCYRMRANLTALDMQMTMIQSNAQMMEAIKSMNGILRGINKHMNIGEINAILSEFQQQNETLDLKQEVIDDALDDAFKVDGEDADSDEMVNQVLQEFGAGTTTTTTGTTNADELQKRLENLRK